ncbi:unnamed protein product [Effrenium voratum]|nr:unnamed protein product [Effrenium voratum]
MAAIVSAAVPHSQPTTVNAQTLAPATVIVLLTHVPFANNIEVHVPTWATLDYIKEIVTEYITTRALELAVGGGHFRGHFIPKRDWGFWSRTRSAPYNMPVLSLKAEDQPLRFCWHDWSPSFQRLRGWELIAPFMPKDEEASAPTVLGLEDRP